MDHRPAPLPRGGRGGRGGLYADWEECTLDVVGHLRLAAGKYPEDPRLASLIGELAMGSERFRDEHPLVGDLGNPQIPRRFR